MFVNLLPANTQLKIQFRSMFRGYAVVWGLGGFCVGLCMLLQFGQLWQANHDLALLEERCEPVYALRREIAQDQQQLQLLQTQLDTLNRLEPSDHFLDLLGVLVQATRSEEGRLHIQRLNLLSGQMVQPAPGAPAAAKPSSSQPTTSMLSLSGLADDDATVTKFVATLRSTGVFDQVDLKASSQVGGEEVTTRQYQLECRYQDVP
jgi:Tfp pilus assembly protein PilN